MTQGVCWGNEGSVKVFRSSKAVFFTYPAGIYLLKVNNGNTRRMCDIFSKVTIKLDQRQ